MLGKISLTAGNFIPLLVIFCKGTPTQMMHLCVSVIKLRLLTS